jgi:diguanylate cyclase
VYHDPKGPGAPRRGWLSRLFASDDAKPVASILPEMALPSSPAFVIEDGPPLSDLAAMAEQLAALIEIAKSRLDGAVTLVDRSADEAAAYGEALSGDADRLDAAGLPVEMAETLLSLTRMMIERTQSCEARLRATTSELRVLQRDLDVAQENAERDPLTGLPNRRGIEHALQCAIKATEATSNALSVAFCDIDAFQRLTEVHGHGVGDRVLRLVADSLTEGAGEGAIVGRQGSEEFVLVFDGVPVIEAAARVDAVRASLAERNLRSRSDGTPIGTVTFSAGVAGHRSRENSDDLLRRADEALLRAKQSGGNQVMIETD